MTLTPARDMPPTRRRALASHCFALGVGFLLGCAAPRAEFDRRRLAAPPALREDAAAAPPLSSLDAYHAFVRDTLAQAQVPERRREDVAKLARGTEARGIPGPVDTSTAVRRWADKSYLQILGLDVRWVAEQHHLQYGEPWFKGRAELEIVTALGLARGHRLLEMGCGALRAGAHIIEYLEPDRYWGVDIDELSLRAGVQYELPVRGLTARRPRFLLNANFELERLPGASGVLFDFVVFFAVLKPNIRKLWEPALAHTRARLAPGGRVVIAGDWPEPFDGAGVAPARMGGLECRKLRLVGRGRSIWSSWSVLWVCGRDGDDLAAMLRDIEARGAGVPIPG